jgi:hypothetical protein
MLLVNHFGCFLLLLVLFTLVSFVNGSVDIPAWLKQETLAENSRDKAQRHPNLSTGTLHRMEEF